MEYIYAALLLNSAGKEITEDAVKAILVAGGVEANEARVKALVAALEGVDIAGSISFLILSTAIGRPLNSFSNVP